MKIFLAIIIFGISPVILAQDFIRDLNGFRLGQLREVPKNELKTLIKSDKFEDGFEYEAYKVEPDKSVYMIFEYAKYELNMMWSIQITGTKKGYDCKFKGLRLGMLASDVKKTLGIPSSISDIGEYGKRWNYDETNYSLEIAPEGVLSSIKISDQYPSLTAKDTSKIPVFEQYAKILRSRDRKAISELLAPGLEIYKNDSTYSFRKTFANEVAFDYSGIFKLINEMAEIINKIDPHNENQYEENTRIALKQDPLHVVKFQFNGKKYEMVFKYMFGKYLIWEISL